MISFLYNFDYDILSFWHETAVHLGGFLTPLFKVISFIGEKGIWLFALAVILMCFAKTRKIGICLFGAVCCGALRVIPDDIVTVESDVFTPVLCCRTRH